jgi:hypothetical protein
MAEADVRIPRSALILGVLGVAPFAALSAATVSGLEVAPIPTVPALETYAAVILSFMGGAQWGLTVAGPTERAANPWRRFGISVLPALVGWGALLAPARPALLLLAAAFALLAAYDLWSVRRGEAPAWYGRLRLGLTLAVVACLAVAALAIRP